MSARLLPCPGCARHVRATESLCPFCGGALPVVAAPAVARRGSSTASSSPLRLGRAATFLFGAAIAGSAASACGATPLYGAPPPDGGFEDTGTADTGTADAAMPGDASADGSADGGMVGDAAADALVDSGATDALYGGPPADSGPSADGALPDV